MSSERFPGEKVTYTRRFFGDNVLENVLQRFTFGIGWLIWLAIIAPKGQSPAKQLVNVYVYDYETAAVASAARVWLREFVAKGVLPFALVTVGALAGSPGLLFLGFAYSVVGAITIFFNEERRALWDYVAGTIVRYQPTGQAIDAVSTGTASAVQGTEQRLRELDRLRAGGLISDTEYDEKRRQVLADI